jgi:hypothetical protein
MILATTKVDDLDRFVKIYSTKGAEKRKLHGSKGSTAFTDPNEEGRVSATMQEAGHQGRPQVSELVGRFDA